MASRGTTDKPMTLFDAIGGFIGPMAAEYARLLEDWDHAAPVQIILGRRPDEAEGGYVFNTTIGVIQDLDRAHQAAFELKEKKAAADHARKSKGTLL